jgi:hypothetical protein
MKKDAAPPFLHLDLPVHLKTTFLISMLEIPLSIPSPPTKGTICHLSIRPENTGKQILK